MAQRLAEEDREAEQRRLIGAMHSILDTPDPAGLPTTALGGQHVLAEAMAQPDLPALLQHALQLCDHSFGRVVETITAGDRL